MSTGDDEKLSKAELAMLSAEERLKFEHKPLKDWILHRPDSHVGSVAPDDFPMTPFWAPDENTVQYRTVRYTPALIQIFEELIDNLTDNRLRGVGTDTGWIDWTQFTWTLKNNGSGIPVLKHHVKTELYIPEMIFGKLGSSSNYSDADREGGVSGRNGFGAKLANIFSTRFSVDIVDTFRRLHFHQEWTDNMAKTTGPKVIPIDTSKKVWSKPYVKVQLTPDWARLGMPEGMHTPGLHGMFMRRCIEAAATSAIDKATRVTLFVNDWKVPVGMTFRRYASSFVLANPKPPSVVVQPIAVAVAPVSAPLAAIPSATAEVVVVKQELVKVEEVKTEQAVELAAEPSGQPPAKKRQKKSKKAGSVKRELNADGTEVALAAEDHTAGSLRDCLYDAPNPKWEIAVRVCNPQFRGPRTYGFVNCIPSGGKHVTYITDQVKAAIIATLASKLHIKVPEAKEAKDAAGTAGGPKKRRKKESGAADGGALANAKPAKGGKRKAKAITKAQQQELGLTNDDINAYLVTFVNAHIQKPAFDNQRKTNLTTPESQFNPPCQLTPEFLKRLATKGGVVDELIRVHKEYIESKTLTHLNPNKTRVGTISGLPKLEDANWAGTKRSEECTLVLTEGDSAKSLVVAGLSVVGRDAFGCLPLKGVPKNARLHTKLAMLDNEEWKNIMRVVGLEFGCTYSTNTEEGLQQRKKLRYGKLALMGDPDSDGRKIVGSMHSNFMLYWPEWTKENVTDIRTPAFKLTHKHNKNTVLEFENDRDFHAYLETHGGAAEVFRSYHTKFHKGLGTFTPAEGMEIFSALDKNQRKLAFCDEKRDLADIETIYGKNAAARRKWLDDPVPDFVALDVAVPGMLPMSHMNHYHQRDAAHEKNIRQLATLLDGLIQGQRKIVHYMLAHNIQKQREVEPLAGEVKSHTDYPHGVDSLHDTIINLSQEYIGSLNVPLLQGVGAVGTRAMGGKDHAAPRYVSVHLRPYTKYIFRDEDRPILPRWPFTAYDEPCALAPIIPMVLVNGAEGIGIGRRTTVVSHRPSVLIRRLRVWLNLSLQAGAEPKVDTDAIVPWSRGFRGTITKKAERHFVSHGRWRWIPVSEGGATTADGTTLSEIEVTELPLHLWLQDFKTKLKKHEDSKVIGRITHQAQILDNIEFISYRFVLSEVKLQHLRLDPSGLDAAVNSFLDLSQDLQTPKQEMCLWSYIEALSSPAKAEEQYYYPGLKVYQSTDGIFEEYCVTRLALYEKRKQYQICEAVAHVRWLELQVQFLTEILDEKDPLVIRSRDEGLAKADALRRLTAAVHQAGAITDEEINKLFLLAILKQTTQHSDRLRRDLQDAKDALETLRAEKVQTVWLRELAELEPRLPTEELATAMPDMVGARQRSVAGSAAGKLGKTGKTGVTKPRKPRVKKEPVPGGAPSKPRKRKTAAAT